MVWKTVAFSLFGGQKRLDWDVQLRQDGVVWEAYDHGLYICLLFRGNAGFQV